MATSFKAAENNAQNMSWRVGIEQTADYELDDSSTLITLRRRSRQLVKDSEIVAGLQQKYINIVGTPTRIVVKADSTIRQQQAQSIVDEFWEDCTIDNLSGEELTEYFVAAGFVDGDFLVSLPLDTEREEGKQTVVEMIEAQRIRTPVPYKHNKTNINVRHGVVYDKAGRLSSYYVKKYEKVDYYGDNEADFDKYPRVKNGRRVTDLFRAPLNARPKMSRQYPPITPCISTLKLLTDYIEAIVVGARVAACFSAFVTSNNPARTYQALTTDSNGEVLDPQDGNQSRRVHKLFPGMVAYLKQNEKVDFGSPNRPNDNVDAFILRLLKLIASYFGIPYEIAFLDLSETNYSSWRGGALEVKKLCKRWRNRIDKFWKWILTTKIREAQLYGLVREGDVTLEIKWPSHGILDAEKEGRANGFELANKTGSPQDIADERGVTYESIQDNLDEHALREVDREAAVLIKKKELEEKHGIVFPERRAREDNSIEVDSDSSEAKEKSNGSNGRQD